MSTKWTRLGVLITLGFIIKAATIKIADWLDGHHDELIITILILTTMWYFLY